MRDGALPRAYPAPPQTFRRLPVIVNGLQEESPILDDISALDIASNPDYVVAVNGAGDGLELVPAGAGLPDGDYGDITVSASGTAMTIDNGAVTLAKQANMATASLVYRKTAGSGAPEVQTLATLKTDLGLTGTNSGDQTSVSGNAGTATALQNARNFSITGKATASAVSFDGTAAVALNVTALTVDGAITPTTVTASGQINSVGLKDAGAVVARFEGTGAGIPSGSTGVGHELFVTGGAAKHQSYNRTTSAFAPMVFEASTFTFTGTLPTFNQNTTGSAATLTTPRTISITGKATAAGGTFDGSAALALNITAVTLAAGDIPNIAESQVTNLVTDLAAKAPLASPVFTGYVYFQQGAPTANTAATHNATIAELLTGLITETRTSAITFNLPTGSNTDAGILSGALANDRAFDWVIINLGSSSGAVTVTAATGHTVVGNMVVAISTSARFRTRKTATNTFITYRIG